MAAVTGVASPKQDFAAENRIYYYKYDYCRTRRAVLRTYNERFQLTTYK